jgi:ParB family chromosome partitioning protein
MFYLEYSALKIEISDIKIGARFRKDFGDLRPLINSIKNYGLLQPIVISGTHELICGRRRIEAYRHLKITEIEANSVSLRSAHWRRAEAGDNMYELLRVT